jgi:hypothetical protein
MLRLAASGTLWWCGGRFKSGGKPPHSKKARRAIWLSTRGAKILSHLFDAVELQPRLVFCGAEFVGDFAGRVEKLDYRITIRLHAHYQSLVAISVLDA